MNCQVCDAELPENASFCSNCGARVRQVAVASPVSTDATVTLTPHEMLTTYTPLPDYRPVTAPASNAAVVSLVFGILSWTVLPVIAPFVAIVAGHMARAEIRRSEGRVSGGGMALAGLILAYLQLGLMVAGCLLLVLLAVVMRAAG